MKKIVIDARESGTSTGRYIDKLIENLSRLKPKYKIVLLAKAHRMAYLNEIAPNFEVKETKFKEFTFGEQIRFKHQIKKEKADLVFFPAVHQPVFYRGTVVTTVQDFTTVRFRNPTKNWLVFTLKRWVYIWVNKHVIKKSKLLITPTEFVKNDIANFSNIDLGKVTVTHESADKIKDKAEPVEELKGKKFIVFVGRPTPHKNLRRLIMAFVKLQAKHKDLRLVFVGKQDESSKKHEEFVKSEGIKNVVWTGFLSEGQLRWIYENTACYCFPSLSEGFGLPGLEAQVHGAPVAASDATCIPEVLGDGANYFKGESVDDIAEKINEVITDSKLRKKLITAGTKNSLRFSWQRMAKQTLEVFNKALDS